MVGFIGRLAAKRWRGVEEDFTRESIRRGGGERMN
jgi:hypothetical protein